MHKPLMLILLVLTLLSCSSRPAGLESQLITSHNIVRHTGFSNLGPITEGDLSAGETWALRAFFERATCYVVAVYGERELERLRVVVTGPDDSPLAEEQSASSNAVLSFCAERSGEHHVTLSTEAGAGAFQLAYWFGGTTEQGPSQVRGNVLMVGHSLNGNLPAGTRFVDYSMQIQRSRQVTIDLESREFDPFLYLLRDGFEIARNDDGGSGLNSRITSTLQPGTYTVRVGSFGNQGSGRFSLRAH